MVTTAPPNSMLVLQFIDTHIEGRRPFAFENALRSDACFQRIRRAKEMGFHVVMTYTLLDLWKNTSAAS